MQKIYAYMWTRIQTLKTHMKTVWWVDFLSLPILISLNVVKDILTNEFNIILPQSQLINLENIFNLYSDVLQ